MFEIFRKLKDSKNLKPENIQTIENVGNFLCDWKGILKINQAIFEKKDNYTKLRLECIDLLQETLLKLENYNQEILTQIGNCSSNPKTPEGRLELKRKNKIFIYQNRLLIIMALIEAIKIKIEIKFLNTNPEEIDKQRLKEKLTQMTIQIEYFLD